MIYDVIIIGGGAAGLMCAIESAKRGRRTLVLERASKIGKKILISGGGRCNFTNLEVQADRYISQNPHFCKSALARFTQHDFIDLVEKHRIKFHEKKLGQLFCDESARQIVGLLEQELGENSGEIRANCTIDSVQRKDHFCLSTSLGELNCESLVVATGGVSIPKMGATAFGYELAKQFGLAIVPCFPGLVPFTLSKDNMEELSGLAGVSMDAEVRCNSKQFRENILITHRGLSGPATLQISSYWKPGQQVDINLLPEHDAFDLIKSARQTNGRQTSKSLFESYLPNKLVQRIFETWLPNRPLAELTAEQIQRISQFFSCWQLRPAGTEGYRTAEVTVGGVDTSELSSKTFEARNVPGLYFIGEVVDVTGWLGGYNFQWAWSSGYCAGQYV